MRVIRSKVLGYCSGVRMAVDAALRALGSSESSRKKVYSFGPLIHNPVALEKLREAGLNILTEKEISLLDSDCVVLIRAHGISPDLRERIEKSGASIVDSTCPRVALSQRRAFEAASAGKTVLLCGDRGHAEVKAIEGSAGKNFILIQNEKEAEEVIKKNELKGPVLLLSQTTFSPEEFKKIFALVQKAEKSLNAKIEVFDSICPATQNHQKALYDLAETVDALVVAGGKDSANSRRLFQRALSLKPSYFVETASDLPKDFGGAEVIGITAGSSTPDFVIDEVEAAIKKMKA